MNRRPLTFFVASLALSGFFAGAAKAEPALSRFPLTKALPSDVFIAVAARSNPEREFINKHWEEVFQAFKDSGIMTDVWELISDNLTDERMEAIEKLQDRFSTLCTAVDWSGLFEQEMIYGGRLSPNESGMGYDGVMMGRLTEKDAKKNYEALRDLLAEIVKLVHEESGGQEVTFTETKEGGLTVASLTPTEMPTVGVYVSTWKDVLIVGFGGKSLMDEAVLLLRGESKKGALVATERFKKAFTGLAEPEDELVFFDIKQMLTPMKKLIDTIDAAQSRESAKEDEESQGEDGDEKKAEDGEKKVAAKKSSPLKLISKLIDEFMIIDHVATVKWTDGYRAYTDSVTALAPNAKSSGLYPILASGKPIKNFEEFIPKGAQDFSVSSGIDLIKLYHYILDFTSENVDGGDDMIAHIKQMEKQVLGLDIEKDVLSLFGGESAHYTQGDEWMLMIKVTNEEKFQAQFDRLISAVNGMLGKENALITTKVKVTGDRNFTQISHPMMAMIPGGFGAPVMGCARGYFMFTSSVKTANGCLKTAAGESPNITKSKRWTAEALKPDGPVTSIAYTDESKYGQELQQVVGLISMTLGMGGMFAADAPPEVRKMLTTIPPLLAKLAPVAGKIDFYQSSASYETFDGMKWTHHDVQNYKVPKKKTAEEDDTDGDSSEDTTQEGSN